jgi:hypothetical protein
MYRDQSRNCDAHLFTPVACRDRFLLRLKFPLLKLSILNTLSRFRRFQWCARFLEQNSVLDDVITGLPPIAVTGYNVCHVEPCIMTTSDLFHADVSRYSCLRMWGNRAERLPQSFVKHSCAALAGGNNFTKSRRLVTKQRQALRAASFPAFGACVLENLRRVNRGNVMKTALSCHVVSSMSISCQVE